EPLPGRRAAPESVAALSQPAAFHLLPASPRRGGTPPRRESGSQGRAGHDTTDSFFIRGTSSPGPAYWLARGDPAAPPLAFHPGDFVPRTPLLARSRGPRRPAPLAFHPGDFVPRTPLLARSRGPRRPAPLARLARSRSLASHRQRL